MKNEIYIVLFDWASDTWEDVETYLFHDFKDARKKFDELIRDELNAELSWVGSEAFDENKQINEDFTFKNNIDSQNTQSLFWYVSDNYILNYTSRKSNKESTMNIQINRLNKTYKIQTIHGGTKI